MIYWPFFDRLYYSGVLILSCFPYFGLCCCPQRSESVCGHPPIPRSAPRVFQVTRTTTAWVPSASAHCWAPSQPSSSTPTQRLCWDAPYRPRGFRSWQSSWRMTPPWGQGHTRTLHHSCKTWRWAVIAHNYPKWWLRAPSNQHSLKAFIDRMPPVRHIIHCWLMNILT